MAPKDTPWKCKRCQTTGQMEDVCDSCGSPPDWVPTPPPRNVPTPEQEAAENERLRVEQEQREIDLAKHAAKVEATRVLERKKFDDLVISKIDKPITDALAVVNPLAAEVTRLRGRIEALEAAQAVRGAGK